MEKKKREEFIDIAKGIAILCVIIGHTWKNAYPADKSKSSNMSTRYQKSPHSSGD